MNRWLVVSLMTLGIAAHVSAQESNILARFEGAIGVSPIANVVLSPNADGTFTHVIRNVVRGVDFKIDNSLNPSPPAECARPLLLIRSSRIGAWFAAAIPKRGNGE